MKLFSRIMSGILLLGVSLSVYADSITIDTIESAATRQNELSRQLLVMIFGDVVNNPINPTTQSLIGELYGIFNGIICGLAFLWFMGITLRTVGRAGHRGKVFGQGHTLMAPVSSLGGFMALVPTPSGWSISNLVFLWMASVMGVGSADLLTDKAADAVMSGQSMIVQPVAGQTVSAARGMYEMYLCEHALNAEQETMHEDGSSTTPAMSESALSEGNGIKISNGSAVCGTAELPSVADVESNNFTFGFPINIAPVENAQKGAFETMKQSLNTSATNFVTTYSDIEKNGSGDLPDAESDIQNAARVYEDTINASVQNLNNDDTIQSQVSNYLKTYGWITLGAWYQTFATINNKTNDIAKLAPIVTGTKSLGDIGTTSYYTQIDTAYRAQRQNSTYTPPAGTITPPDPQEVANIKSPTDALKALMPSTQRLTNWIAQGNYGTLPNSDSSNQVNPLLKMKAIGDYTLGAAETAFTVYTIAKGYQGWEKGKSIVAQATGLFNAVTGAGDAANGILDAIAPPVYFLVFILFSIGLSLSIFLPFIPFIYWLTACASWLASVLLGTTAGSLWAWTHIGGEEDKGSRSAYGYIYLVDAAIRPSLMVFGFFFSSLVIIAIGTLLNVLFTPALANVQSDSMSGLASMIGILMLYCRLCTTLASTVFSLQVYLPDYVIAWLGGKEAAQLMNGAVESAKNMFIAFGSGAGHTPNAKKIVSNENADKNKDGFI
ncbi:DotA/TraY family protein [Salmonella enterica]|nr:DotA/TraY family protein [Salmonella enterica]